MRNYLGVLHSLLTYAEKRDWIASNPCLERAMVEDARPLEGALVSPRGRPAVARSLLKSAGIDPSATPSELPPESWAAVTRALSAGASSRAAP